MYTGLKHAIGLGSGIRNINSVDPDIVQHYREVVDVSIPSYRKIKEIVHRYTPSKKAKNIDFFKEMKETKKPLAKDVRDNSYTTGNESSFDSGEFTSVSKLQYSAKNWKIKVRVTKRSHLIQFNSSKGAGTLFNVELIDTTGCEILASFFNVAAEKFDSLIKEKKTYIMSGGKIQLSKNSHSSISNKYSINFPPEAVIKEIEDDNTVPVFSYSFMPLNKIREVKDGKQVDVIGVVHSMHSPLEFQRGDKPQTKRQLTLVDDSGTMINV